MLWWSLHQLKSSNPGAKIKSARELGAAKERKAVSSLVELLKDENPDVRSAAIESLGAIGHPASVEPLISALSSPHHGAKTDSAEHELIAKALVGVGTPAVKPLIQALASEDKQARRWAAFALGRIKDRQAVDPLIERLDDGRSEVRKAAALALGEIGDLRAVKALVQALANRDGETRRAVADALGCMPSEEGTLALIKAVADPSESVQIAVINALAKSGSLVAAASLRSAMSGMRRTAHDVAESALGKMIFSPTNAKERAEAAVFQGDFDAASREGPAAVTALVGALEFMDPKVRVKAVQALVSLRSPDSVRPLLHALRDHDAAVQESAARALADIGEAAREGLEEALSFYDASVVRLAAGVLGEIGNPSSIAALASLIAENSRVPGDYPDLFDAISGAVESLRKILSLSAAKVPQRDLEHVTTLPRQVRLLGPSPKNLDCSHLHELAEELLARNSQ